MISEMKGGSDMNWKSDFFLSLGALLPLFLVSLIVSVLLIHGFPFFITTLSLFLGSAIVNIYLLKYVAGKKKFNPRAFKIVNAQRQKGSEPWVSIISTVGILVTLLFADASSSVIVKTVIFAAVSFILLVIFTFFAGDELISMVLLVRIKYPKLYVIKIEDSNDIYIMSREKIRANSELKAYSLMDDFFLFGYMTS